MSTPNNSSTYIICTLDTCPITWAFVEYLPTLAGNAIYLAIFAIILITQLYLGIRHRTWGFLAGMVGGGILEIVGYLGRLLLHSDPFNFNYFLVYLICLTIGPVFVTASIYLCLARLIVVYGEKLSRFRPRTYTISFISCDFISLVLQSIGGGITATSDSQTNDDSGVHIMIAGLAFQVFSLVLFMVFCTEFAYCVRRCQEGKDPRFEELRNSGMFKAFPYALAIATIAIFIRSVYRVAELSGGFSGALANNQITFMILEGPMIIIAIAVMTLFHPGTSFCGNWAAAGWKLRGKSG